MENKSNSQTSTAEELMNFVRMIAKNGSQKFLPFVKIISK